MNKEVSKKTKLNRYGTSVENYDEELKNEVVSHYLENGAFQCEKKFRVPRQTVRHWALKTGKAEIGRHLDVKYRAKAVKLARKEGVKKALQMFPVARTTLYYWANLCGGEISERHNLCLQITVNQQGLKRRIVFRKVVKPKKVKVKKVKKVIVKKEKPRLIEAPREILPTWAADFLKPTIKRNYGITLPRIISC